MKSRAEEKLYIKDLELYVFVLSFSLNAERKCRVIERANKKVHSEFFKRRQQATMLIIKTTKLALNE